MEVPSWLLNEAPLETLNSFITKLVVPGFIASPMKIVIKVLMRIAYELNVEVIDAALVVGFL